MRHFKTSSLPAVLLTGALLGVSPVFAQTAAVTAPTVTAPTASPAVSSPAATVVVTPNMDTGLSAPLTIPMPPGSKLRVEMDARSEDVLGMMKSFLKGIGETTPASQPGQPMASRNPVADLLVNGNLAEILKDVNHVHFVVYELAPSNSSSPSIFPAPKKAASSVLLNTMPTEVVLPPVSFDSNAYYETAFGAEGAHRIMFADADQYKLVMVGFPNRKGYAFAASGGGYVAVSRIDGYPNLEVLSAFMSRATAAIMNSDVVKDAIKKGANGGKFVGGENVGKNLEKK